MMFPSPFSFLDNHHKFFCPVSSYKKDHIGEVGMISKSPPTQRTEIWRRGEDITFVDIDGFRWCLITGAINIWQNI
jgi:hypothetical protein